MLRCPNRCTFTQELGVCCYVGTDFWNVTNYNPQNDIDISITQLRILSRERTHDAFRLSTGQRIICQVHVSAASKPRGPVCFSRVLGIGTRGSILRRPSATARNVAASFPNWVLEIFHWLNPSGMYMVPGSTQPPSYMNIRNISWEIKAAGV
jgi:hypothetical protein